MSNCPSVALLVSRVNHAMAAKPMMPTIPRRLTSIAISLGLIDRSVRVHVRSEFQLHTVARLDAESTVVAMACPYQSWLVDWLAPLRQRNENSRREHVDSHPRRFWITRHSPSPLPLPLALESLSPLFSRWVTARPLSSLEVPVAAHASVHCPWTSPRYTRPPSTFSIKWPFLLIADVEPLFPVAGHPIIFHHLFALRKLPSVKEVLLIGFYEESVFRDFLKSASEQFPNWTIK